jgi:membrane protease subunit HflK
MPWNDNANSGGKPDKKPGGKPSPWGAPPPPSSGGGSGGGDRPPPRRPTGGLGGGGPRRPGQPDVADLGRQLGDRLREMLGGDGRGPNRRLIGLIAAGVFGLWLLSGFYIVQSNEQAVVTTLGAYSRTSGPGMHYHAPFPVERVRKVPVTTIRATQIGGGAAGEALDESLMLTSDENIIDLDFTVQWKVANARNYLFSLDNPPQTVADVAESAMREVVGKTSLQAIITTQRGRVQAETLDLMQRMLDSYNAGITVREVLIDNAGPPPPVIAAFREVTAAEQEAESVQNVARGRAATIEAEARAYANQIRNEAEGEAARFNQLYEQYKLAPAVTRDRLYIETMQRVLSQANKVVIDSKGASAPIILPPDVFRPRGAPQPSAGQPPTPEVRAGGAR